MNSIDIFPWNENFNTGIPLIDEQHRKLADLINLLASHVAFNANIPALNVIFDELAEYAVYHFNTEEKIWHEYMSDDPFEASHHEVHCSFLTEVLKLKSEEITKPTSKVIEEILSFLTRWLAAHILESDRSMAMIVMAMQSGISLDSAKKQAHEQMKGATKVLIDIILSIYESLSKNTLQLMRELAAQKRMTMLLDDQERHFEILLSTIPVGVFETDINGNCSYINALWSEITGLSFDEAKGDGWIKAVHPEDKDKIYFELAASTSENRPFHLEYRFFHPDGKIVWVLGQSANYKSSLNDQSGYVGTITDISERKQAEVNLQRESEKSLALLRNASDGIHILDFDGNVVEASDSFCNMLGYSRNEVIGMNVSAWDTGFVNAAEQLKVVRKQFEKSIRTHFETSHRRKNGSIFDVEISGFPHVMDGQKVLFNFSRDITSRKQVESQLLLHSTVLENIAEGVFLIRSSDSIIVFTNPQFDQIFGYLEGELVGQHVSIVNAPSEKSPEEVAETINKLLQRDGEWHGEVHSKRKDGTTFWTHASISTFNHSGFGQVWVAVQGDITERKLAENELKSTSRYVRSLIEASLDPLVTISAEGKITDVNTATEKVTGVDRASLIGSDFANYFTDPEEARKGYQKVFSQGSVTDYSLAIRHTSGEVTDVLYNASVYKDPDGKVQGVFAAARDVTERKHAETTLIEREAHLRFILENSPIAVRITSMETGKVKFANQYYAKLTNLALDEVIGLDPKLYYSNPQDYIDVIDSINKGERVTNKLIEILDFTKPIKSKWTLASYMPIKFDNGPALLGWFYDVTESKNTYEVSERLLAIIEEAPDFIATSDMQAHIKYLNKAGAKLVGLAEGADLGTLEIKDMHPAWATKRVLEEGIPTVLKQGFWHGETALLDREGNETPVSQLLMVHRDKFGNPEFLSTIMRDITASKLTENALRIAATAFESQEGIMVTDAKNIILRVNQAFTRITGYTAEESVGQTPRLLSSGRQDKFFYGALWECLNRTGAWEGEIWNRRKNGEIYPEHLTITVVKDANGIITNYVATLTDITTSKAASDEIKNLAFYDPLTRLPNRRLLMDRLNQALAASTRSGLSGAVLFLDLDHFKTLNDTLGHDVGDLLLQQVASRLNNCVREGDTVARIGGDEFVVLLEDLGKQMIEAAAQAEVIAQKIQASLSQTYQLGTYEYHSTSSLGATLFSDHEVGLDTILKQADIAMYQSKIEGRNTLRFYDPKMQEAITTRVDMQHELRQAIEQEQFQLYYQMQVDSTGHPFGAEALIRWHHPKRNMIPPLQFIPLAEETGLILPIGQWVLDTACAQLKIWHQNPQSRDFILSINVSAKQLYQENFVIQVKETIQRHEIDPTKLKLELTESMLIIDIDDIIFKMTTLSQIGVLFSLDDFGTGYSSLQYLKKLPLNQLKIDQSFVRDIVTDPSDRNIVSTIITMAHSLDINVIAEGVETEEQRQFLLDTGCMHYQGYLFGKPLPINEFEEALKRFY